MAVIGIDFGNVNSFPAFIMDLDERTLRGGTELTLLPAESRYNAGIPTTYFYSKRRGELYGTAAATATPLANRVNLLKRKFTQKMIIDGRTVVLDDVITGMIEHIVRVANQTMQQNYRMTTNEIALAYPVEFLHSQLMHLVTLAQKATLEDGRHVKVTGTIREPAAAALAYLGSQPLTRQDYNVLVYDLGGGTFDISSVTAHLKTPISNGVIDHYDVLGMDGLKIGGWEFDEAMYELFAKKTKERPGENRKDAWMIEAERVKIALSNQEEEYLNLSDLKGEPYDINITRTEYEKAVQSLVDQTITCVESLLARPGIPEPDLILLTGGQSQMPMIQRTLAERLPRFSQRIQVFKPQHAIAFGAARYGILEPPVPEKKVPFPVPYDPERNKVIRRTMFDIGLRGVRDSNGVARVDTIIPSGTMLPTGNPNAWRTYGIGSSRRYDHSIVVEAKKINPDIYNQEGDYNEITAATLDFGREMPEGTRVEICLYVDNTNLLHLYERDPRNPGEVKEAFYNLKNLG